MRKILSTALAAVLATTPMAGAEEAPDPGETAFLEHCAGCHGAGAAGDGPIAALLTVEVPDLTVLAAENGGAFPMLEVVHVIDGRSTRAGHGGPMPVFGALLKGEGGVLDGPGGTPVITRGIILSLAYYLEGLQR